MPNEPVSKDLVSYLEAEQFSGLSRGTLRRLIGNGQLSTTKIGRETRIDKHSLEAFVENHPKQLRLFD